MSSTESVIYNGYTCFVQSNGKYFAATKKVLGQRLLHRIVWSEVNGQIPEGCNIHHIDGDWRNNSIENLELVNDSEHKSAHMTHRWTIPEYQDIYLAAQKRAIVKAVDWHSSEEGLAWHSENGKKVWVNRAQHDSVCTMCGSGYQTPFPTRSRFCSAKCRRKSQVPNHPKVEKLCLWCGVLFERSKYEAGDCCSRLCGNRRRGFISKASKAVV